MKKAYKVRLNSTHTAPTDRVVTPARNVGEEMTQFIGNTTTNEVFLYSLRDAKNKAENFNGVVVPHKFSFVVSDFKLGVVDEDNLLDGVVKLMNQQQAFKDVDNKIGDKIYYANVFDNILENYVGGGKTNIQLNELATYFRDYDYIMITNVHKNISLGLGLD